MRPATVADAAGVARVQVVGWRTAYRGIVPDPFLDAMAADRARIERWRNILAAGASAALVAEARGHVVGFAVGGRLRDADPRFDGELSALYVRPAWQGRGLGRLLLSGVAAELAGTGFRSMKVWVLRENPYRGFYERLGGRPCDRRTDVRNDGALTLVEVAFAFDLPLRA